MRASSNPIPLCAKMPVESFFSSPCYPTLPFHFRAFLRL